MSGGPPSANGASSFHLGWVLGDLAGGSARSELVEAEVTFEVLEPPSVASLYFWALQVDVADGSRRVGGAHLGLQWHPSHPGATAVNWGGYHQGGGELDGTRSALPSATGNPNTRDLGWAPGRRYRLRVVRAATSDHGAPAWRGSVRELGGGPELVVRDLFLPGDRLAGVTMWSEVFADCDAPSVLVRWSDPLVRRRDGRESAPVGLSVNYQSDQQGGCANTDSSPDPVGVLQRTSTSRRTPQGTRLSTHRS